MIEKVTPSLEIREQVQLNKNPTSQMLIVECHCQSIVKTISREQEDVACCCIKFVVLIRYTEDCLENEHIIYNILSWQ